MIELLSFGRIKRSNYCRLLPGNFDQIISNLELTGKIFAAERSNHLRRNWKYIFRSWTVRYNTYSGARLLPTIIEDIFIERMEMFDLIFE